MAIRTSPVGYTFTALRILQCISICPIVVLTGVLGLEVDRLEGPRQPFAVVFSLTVCLITLAYAFTTLMLHVCGPSGHLADAPLDGAVAVVVLFASVYIGQPLARLDCSVVGERNARIKSLRDVLFSTPASDDTTWKEFTGARLLNMTKLRGEGYFGAVARGAEGLRSVGGLPALGSTREEIREQMSDYRHWVGRVEHHCLKMKVAWGFSILIPFLFAATAILAFTMWRRKYRIKTFRVETVDGEQIYTTHHEHSPSVAMSDVSIPETDVEGSIEYSEYHPSVGAGRYRASIDS